MNRFTDVRNTRTEAEDIARRLQKSGFGTMTMKNILIAGRNAYGKEGASGCYDIRNGMKQRGEPEAFLDSLLDKTFGPSIFSITGIGPV